MRLIDADALKNMRFSCGMLGEDHLIYAPIREVFKNIDKAPTIGGWISVEDRLPEQAGYKCLVCAKSKYGVPNIFTAFTGYGDPGWWTYEVVYMEKERETDNRVSHNYHITHWMPLPEPPEEVKKDG